MQPPNRSLTPVPPPQPVQPPAPQNAAAATNQATVGMGALNLGSLMNPAVLAAAQVALFNSLTGGPDLATLISNLQTNSQLSQQSNGPPGTPGQNVSGASGWWPSSNTSGSGGQSVQNSDLMSNGGGANGGNGRNQSWSQDENWR